MNKFTRRGFYKAVKDFAYISSIGIAIVGLGYVATLFHYGVFTIVGILAICAFIIDWLENSHK